MTDVILSDVWSYDVRLKEWSQLHDGDGWRTASDAHLHGQPTINAADYESSYRSATAPEPRHLHTSIPVLKSNVLTPGPVLVKYKGLELEGMLLSNGNFNTVSGKEEYTSTSSFALFMMQSINPTVRIGVTTFV